MRRSIMTERWVNSIPMRLGRRYRHRSTDVVMRVNHSDRYDGHASQDVFYVCKSKEVLIKTVTQS